MAVAVEDLLAQVPLGRAHLVAVQAPEAVAQETLAQQGELLLMSHLFPVITKTVHRQLQHHPTEAEDTMEAVRQQPTSLEADLL